MAATLDKSLEDWSQTVPLSCSYSMERIEKDYRPKWMWALLDGAGSPQYSHIYPSRLTELMWRLSWTTRLILNQALLHTLDVLQGMSSTATLSDMIHPEVIQINLLLMIDRLCESCLAPFTNASQNNPPPSAIGDIHSLRGYALLQPLPIIDLCLDQVQIIGVDFSVKKEWIGKMLGFLWMQIGLAKAKAVIEPHRIESLPVQLWGLAE